jgi:ApaG protein
MRKTQRIEVTAIAEFLPGQSDVLHSRYAFAYDICIRNTGDVPARLVSRHWHIHHGDGLVEEVKGPGVVGEHPHLKPGEEFRYRSGAIIRTPVGAMHGSYQMEADDGSRFAAEIPRFALSMPRTLH